MEYGTGVGTPVTPAIAASGNQSAILTLDDFCRIMDYEPCEFMGVMSNYECSPLTGEPRRRIISAEESAINMIETQLNARKSSLYDHQDTLSSLHPYFNLLGYTTKQFTRKTYTATIEIDTSVGDCSTYLATLTATIDALADCEELYGVRVIWPGYQKRLGVEFLGGMSLTGIMLTLTAYAYNFIDLDAFIGTVPQDAVPYLSSVDIEVTTKTNSVPRALWYPTACTTEGTDPCIDPLCQYTTTTGCLIEKRNGVWDVENYWGDTCVCYGIPAKFEVEVVHGGIWCESMEEAVISLANTRLPADFCGCNALVNARFLDDNGMSPRYAKVYPYSFNNGFGILAPGAQFAWKQIDRLMSDTIIIRN